MRGLAVLTVAFVFASSALFVGTASAQSSGTLEGTTCITQPSYGMPDNTSASPCNYAPRLPDATVTLSRSGTLPTGPAPLGPFTASATSDSNGYYSFSGLASGDYAFTVTRTGFQDLTGTVSVAAGSMKDFGLTGKVVEAKGKVSDVEGAAIAKATIGVCCTESGYATGTSGADGRYTVSVQAGFYSMDVQAPGFQSVSQSHLVDGSEVNFKLERIPPQDGRVTGLVHDQDGNPVAQARVAISNYGYCCYAYETAAASDSPSGASYSRPVYTGENHTFTDAQGRFTIGAYSGENGLTASKEGYAYVSRGVTVAKGSATEVEVELKKYPEKTARIEGKVVDAKTGKGVPNLYLSLQSPEYGIYECSQAEGTGSSSGGTATAGSADSPKSSGMSVVAPDYASPGCGITTSADGSFSGLVTPGYGILSVGVDWYSSCYDPSTGMRRDDCGPEYYTWSASRTLAPDATTTFDVRLRSRPAPDAEVSGYVVDAESGETIPGAQVYFSNQDTYGSGSAVTDEDGSYRLRLRSGYHTVSVWAEGHLRWEGVLDVGKGDTPFDVEVQPGTESYGGCCYGPYYGGGMAYAAAEDSSMAKASGTGAPAPNVQQLDGSDEDAASGEQYEDLGGGLGPYDAEARSRELDPAADGSPGLGLLAMLAALGVVLVLRRRAA